MEPVVNPPSEPLADEPGADRRTLAERAYIALRDMIVTLRMPPGAPIHEERLSHSLGVGRTPVREAIKRLEAEGLVAIYPRRGTFVSEINITDHGLIAEARRVLEGQAAASAADRATEAERIELTELADRLDGLVTAPEDLMRLDTAIHRVIYRCTHNKYLAGTLTEYYNLTLRIWYLFLPQLTAMSEHIAEHGPLVERIAAGDGEAARELAMEHVTHFEEAVLRALSGR